jgi:hypothetical protein
VVAVLVGVGEQGDARALHPLGGGVLARCLPHLVGDRLGVGVGAGVGARAQLGVGVRVAVGVGLVRVRVRVRVRVKRRLPHQREGREDREDARD